MKKIELILTTKKSYKGWLRQNHTYIVDAFLPISEKVFDLNLTSTKDESSINISHIHLNSFKKKSVKTFLKQINKNLNCKNFII